MSISIKPVTYQGRSYQVEDTGWEVQVRDLQTRKLVRRQHLVNAIIAARSAAERKEATV